MIPIPFLSSTVQYVQYQVVLYLAGCEVSSTIDSSTPPLSPFQPSRSKQSNIVAQCAQRTNSHLGHQSQQRSMIVVVHSIPFHPGYRQDTDRIQTGYNLSSQIR
jgi:hypothetical protein